MSDVYVSTASVKNKVITDSINEILESGFSTIELTGGTNYTNDYFEQLVALKEKFKLNYMVHNYFPPPKKHFVLNLASPVSKSREQSVDFCRQSILLASKLGVDRYTVHAGYAEELVPPSEGEQYFQSADENVVSYDESVNHMYDSVDELVNYAEDHNVLFGLENLFPYGRIKKQPLFSEPDTIFEYLSRFENNSAGLLMDLGHLLISANYFGFDKDKFLKKLTKEYPKKILGIHISGNDGVFDTHCQLTKSDWQLNGLKHFKYLDLPVTLESRGLSCKQIVEQVKLVETYLQG